jgi:DNA-binding HxlR family transcriptional regulator
MDFEDLQMITSRKRSLEILIYLSDAETRNYSEIEDRIDSSSATISETLSLLQEYDLVERNKRSAKDIRYRLTAKGDRFLSGLRDLAELLSET